MLLFIMSLLFQTLGYWVNGGGDLMSFIRVNMFTYLKMGVVGSFVGFILWLFNVR